MVMFLNKFFDCLRVKKNKMVKTMKKVNERKGEFVNFAHE